MGGKGKGDGIRGGRQGKEGGKKMEGKGRGEQRKERKGEEKGKGQIKAKRKAPRYKLKLGVRSRCRCYTGCRHPQPHVLTPHCAPSQDMGCQEPRSPLCSPEPSRGCCDGAQTPWHNTSTVLCAWWGGSTWGGTIPIQRDWDGSVWEGRVLHLPLGWGTRMRDVGPLGTTLCSPGMWGIIGSQTGLG